MDLIIFDLKFDFHNLILGSYSGIVNLYSTEDLLNCTNKEVEPIKVIMNI